MKKPTSKKFEEEETPSGETDKKSPHWEPTVTVSKSKETNTPDNDKKSETGTERKSEDEEYEDSENESYDSDLASEESVCVNLCKTNDGECDCAGILERRIIDCYCGMIFECKCSKKNKMFHGDVPFSLTGVYKMYLDSTGGKDHDTAIKLLESKIREYNDSDVFNVSCEGSLDS